MSPTGMDRFRSWDAAYVLGSLVPSERHEFEEHLAECAGCSAAVAELAGLPSLLATVPPAEAQALVPTADVAAPAKMPLGLADTVRVRRRRTRLAVAALVLGASAASGVITAAVTSPAPPAVQTEASSATALSFTPAGASVLSLSAKGTITGQPWGTRIDWECTYSPAGGDYPSGSGDQQNPEEYSLMVVDSRGVATQVASWTATPGMVATPTATTTIRAADIRRVEIRAAGSGKTLLSAVL